MQYEMTPYMLTVLHCKLCSSLIKVTQQNIAGNSLLQHYKNLETLFLLIRLMNEYQLSSVTFTVMPVLRSSNRRS